MTAKKVIVEDDAEDVEKNPHSFQNVFTAVKGLMKKYDLFDHQIMRFLPFDIQSWISAAQIARCCAALERGEVLEGIMSAKVADGLLKAIAIIEENPFRALGIAPPVTVLEDSEHQGFRDHIQKRDIDPEYLFDIGRIRGRLVEVFHDVGLEPYQAYEHLPIKDRIPDNLYEIQRWFDGTVVDAHKELVSAFFMATLSVVKKKGRIIDEDYFLSLQADVPTCDLMGH